MILKGGHGSLELNWKVLLIYNIDTMLSDNTEQISDSFGGPLTLNICCDIMNAIDFFK